MLGELEKLREREREREREDVMGGGGVFNRELQIEVYKEADRERFWLGVGSVESGLERERCLKEI